MQGQKVTGVMTKTSGNMPGVWTSDLRVYKWKAYQ